MTGAAVLTRILAGGNLEAIKRTFDIGVDVGDPETIMRLAAEKLGDIVAMQSKETAEGMSVVSPESEKSGRVFSPKVFTR